MAADEEVSQRLAVELRDYVRALCACSMFSRDWFDMVESLQHLTNIALMEQLLPKAAPNSTLWERDELTVRFLLEEGKLNLCLRLLVEFKEQIANKTPADILSSASYVGVRMEWKKLGSQLDLFEQSMGLLLNCAFKSVEALQTVDMSVLIQHCAAMLRSVEQNPEKWSMQDIEKRQESLIILYLLSTLRKIESLDEETVMQHIKDHGITLSLINILRQCWQAVPKQVVIACCQVLNLIMDTEHYKTNPPHFIPDDKRILLIELHEMFISSMFVEYEAKKKVSALLFNIENFRVKLGMDL